MKPGDSLNCVTFMMASARFSVKSDFSSTADPRGNFVYDGGSNRPLRALSGTAYIYDAMPEPLRLYNAPLATYAPSHQFARTGSCGTHLLTDGGAWATGKEAGSETGLDYFGARYFSGAQGMFCRASMTRTIGWR